MEGEDGKAESSEEVLFKMTYTGARFENHSLPFSCLAELQYLQKALWELYKTHFRAETGRQRAPKGYQDKLAMSISCIRDGSAIAEIVTTPEIGQLKLENEAKLQLSRALHDIFNVIDNEGSPGQAVEKIAANCFKKFGVDLREGEQVIIQKNGRSVSYTQAKRQQILSRLVGEYAIESEMIFAVHEIDKESRQFTAILPDRNTVRISTTGDSGGTWFETALEAFDSYKGLHKNSKIAISGEFLYNKDHHLIGVSPDTVEPVGPLNVKWRLWQLTIGASPKARETLKKFAEYWDHCLRSFTNEDPYLYLIEDDTLSIEWPLASGELSMTWSPDAISLLFLSALGEEKSAEFESGSSLPAARWLESMLEGVIVQGE